MRAPLSLLLLLVPFAAQAAEADPAQIRRGFEAIEAWRIDEARAIAEEAYTNSPGDPVVLALVAEVKLHMSDYPGAVDFFRRARTGGAPEGLLRNEDIAERAKAATQGYREVVSDHFILRHTPGKDALLVDPALETLEAAMDKVGRLLGWVPTSRVVVEFYPKADTLAAVSTLTSEEIRNSGTIALCKWNRLMVTSPRGVAFGYSWRDTIAHELTHLIIGGASKNTVPIWLHEGLAKYIETAWRGEPGLGLSVDQQTKLQQAAIGKKLIPFSKMHPSMAKLKTQEETALAFAEVFTFIEYLVALKDWGAVRDVLKRMSDGASDEEAIQAVYGTSLKVLSDRWIAGLKNRKIRREGVELAQDRPIEIKKKEDAPDDSLHGVPPAARGPARLADILFARGRLVGAQKELEKAIAIAPVPALQQRLVMIALATGDLGAAETAARAAIAAEPNLAGPHIGLADILVRRGRLEDAKAPLDRALSVNPFDPRIYPLRLQVLGGSGDPKQIAQAKMAALLLRGDVAQHPAELGAGGLVRIEGVPFSRVYIEREGEDREESLSTGVVTPTAPLVLKPGTFRLKLVPPVGRTIIRTITVEPRPADGEPQRIAPDMRGS